MSAKQPVELTIYGRDGCHLCDIAEQVLLDAQLQWNFRLTKVDIDSNDELFKRYLERIPVVELAGETLFEFEVDSASLDAALSDAGTMRIDR
ncbi:MAG: glutaredoxin family protein [Solirubrobacterales bacterium]|nr:glutaredoxin family protein [Solirubrobacterales bacterium]